METAYNPNLLCHLTLIEPSLTIFLLYLRTKFFSFLLLREILYAMPNFIFCEICVFFFSSFQMPVCQFFLRGKCSNDNCPYSHVNVSKKAEVCEDFLKGFCSRGQQVCLLLLFIIILFPAIICIAFELELHLTPEKITEAYRQGA